MAEPLLTGAYRVFYQRITRLIDPHRVFTDPLHTLAYGTDASLYRLIPKIVIKALSERELSDILTLAGELSLPVTVRTAGTSLSGQASTDSILVALNWGFRGCEIQKGGDRIQLEPGVIGEFANNLLKPYYKKIGPDPASIASAMIGGIINNNSSGMCCGVEENSYKTIEDLKIMLYDGTVLDTADPESVARFRESHTSLLQGLASLSKEVTDDTVLRDRIVQKYKIKNTTGYSLNALVDFEDPLDILTHLIVGSEGTLAVLLQATLRTVTEHPLKASAMIYYADIYTACKAVELMKTHIRKYVFAAELFDRISIHTVEERPIAPPVMKTLGPDACALLVETRGFEKSELEENIRRITEEVSHISTLEPIEFTDDPQVYSRYWTLRKGLIPSIGTIRKNRTTVIIEDVAFPIEHLAEATVDMQGLFRKYGYTEGIVMGHALEGNLHLVFAQEFTDSKEVERYRNFMDDLCRITAVKYQGSLKAEHGTGRNVAPFVEMEWGAKAYEIMRRIKKLFDPHNLLNPGVLLHADPELHLKNLKEIPETHPLVDKCIECGFCESECPSRSHSLTPRQRIVISRELSRLQSLETTEGGLGREGRKRYRLIQKLFRYQGDESCATCSMCEPACPVSINTGKLMKELRTRCKSRWQRWGADLAARHFSVLTRSLGLLLLLRQVGERILGKGILPPRLKHFPRPVGFRKFPSSRGKKVIYFPSCLNRHLTAVGEPLPLTGLIPQVLERAGYQVVYPSGVIEQLCCGMPFSSKGYPSAAEIKYREIKESLSRVGAGEYPILIDASPCASLLKEKFADTWEIMDPVSFINKYLLDKLPIQKLDKKITIHTTCSASRMGLEMDFLTLSQALAKEVVVLQGIKCCGFAGDKGFKYPSMNADALATLPEQIQGCAKGYSTSVTCEIGLSEHGRVPYSSVFYLLEEASRMDTL